MHAKTYNIGLTVDAEEADRLDLSLDIFEAVFNDPDLVGWEGLGLALQAYQKRAFYVLDWIVHLAKKQNRRIMVRLVKGAYWDYEIKDSQIKGLEGYPVFTRKVNTDISYIACAKKMAEAGNVIFPQFATHNAHTVAVIMELMKGRHDFEFQALHGMGHVLYDLIVGKENKNIPCRIYAPVGTHEDLLAYLVRRLLENGANTSFVNRIIDEESPIKDLVENPIEKIKNYSSIPNPRIPLPADLFGKDRKNSMGYNLSNRAMQMQLAKDMNQAVASTWYTQPTIGKKLNNKDVISMTNPSDRRQMIGEVMEITSADIEIALQRANSAALQWNLTPVDERAKILERIADLFQQHMPTLMAMAVREAGKNIFDAQGEVREAIDYCRYYAEEARRELIPKKLPGPTGELNQLQLRGRGVIACISPWNFPLAIFSGQITAALVTGNAVIAKPAKQTSLIAGYAVKLIYEAGVPENVLQLLPGSGSLMGEKLIPDPRINGVVFTGSTETGRLINQTLANREGPMIPLIAETGGQNAMIVDATALPEQVVVDALISAFNSAGQRCSALRVLFLQEDIADKVIHMLKGAMEEWQIGDPGLLKTDVGPVIDDDAKKKLEEHAAFLRKEGKLIYQMKLTEACQYGTFFAPCAFEISTLKLLKREVFGPILHVIRYAAKDLDRVIDDINQTGYGLTMGIHSRVDETIEYIKKRVHVGNIYVNRNVIRGGR